MKRLRPLLIIFLLFISVRQTFAQDQQPIYVGIPSDGFNYFASSQHNTNWCWAASIQMIFNYYGIEITQEQIVARSYGVSPTGLLPDWTGTEQVITANLNNWSVDNNGHQYMVRAHYYPGPPTPAYLLQELSLQRPVLIGYQSGPNSGHIVVITACSYINTDNGPVIESVVVRDPWPAPDNVANRGRKEWTGIELANKIQAHWYIVVR
ncbi:MAG: C39 family peptidase [Sphingobacteriales bacterium]